MSGNGEQRDEDVAEPQRRDVLAVWVRYDSAIREADVFESEPPATLGRLGYDIGPIELDEELVKDYAAAKEAWRAAHLHFVAAVRDAQVKT